MEDDSDRQIDALEANRLAQEINRQVHQDIPEFSPESVEVPETREENSLPSAVLNDPPDRELEERAFPRQADVPGAIGGGPDAIQALREEERR